MKAISSTQYSQVTSLLKDGHSLCQIEHKTGLGKSTVGRIKKEVDGDKENNKGGCPSKLSPCDKKAIIHQITSGKLDNAVQATNFINSTLSDPVIPQTTLCYAALWIVSAFHTSPTGGAEALAGLIPVHLHLKKLALWSLFHIATLSRTHPLRSLVGRGTLAEAASKLPQLTECFDANAAEACPGHQLMDCFVDRVKFKEVDNDQDDADKLWALESTYEYARSNLDYVTVATDASVHTDHTIQAVAAVCLLHRDKLLWQFCHAVGKATALDAELFALHLGVEHACHMPDAKLIVLFTDHITAV
ncbi:hypothetical protein D9756_000879 [Leucocoprinus leucothites]|uniref:Uncharacterized protein n=1 Tax=Leucocoprinus leucothites TaxID=201217 RepID=A0A8H5GEK6_9AGAR|nr:hypothetical protein D9756_000879 [Leucoagaricus leucothites]